MGAGERRPPPSAWLGVSVKACRHGARSDYGGCPETGDSRASGSSPSAPRTGPRSRLRMLETACTVFGPRYVAKHTGVGCHSAAGPPSDVNGR
jgi:hypothetical protein